MSLQRPRVDLPQALMSLRTLFAEGWQMDAQTRQRFELASAPQRLDHFLFTGITSVVLFNLFLLSDRLMVPDVFELSVFVRLCLLTPLVLTLVGAGFILRRWWLATMPPWVTESLATLGTMAVSASLGVVMMASHSPMVAVYHAGLLPVVLFGNLVQRLRFRYALASTVFTLGVAGVVLPHTMSRPSVHLPLAMPVALLLLLVALYTLVSNFNLEMDERQRYLQTERARVLRQQLERTQAGLQQMSRLDPLTGLANRRSFDAYVAEQVGGGQRPRALAMLLLDVDHFKAFNDRYGHPAGDQCLRLVAVALQTCMPAQQGLLARWGGEEFAVALPHADANQALALGQALCRQIEALSMRHDASATASHVTISCGVATSANVRDVHDAELLMQQADAALYQAKACGRNRCVPAQS